MCSDLTESGLLLLYFNRSVQNGIFWCHFSHFDHLTQNWVQLIISAQWRLRLPDSAVIVLFITL